MGRNVVSTSQPLAAQAGLSMLLAGGNAVDAAIATAMALTVVEPTGCGLGSDAFCILWDGKELHGLNASGRSPAAWTPEYFEKLGVSFDVPEHTTVALVGESGSGKSVTAMSILNLLPDNAERHGAISFQGRDLLAASR
eukprot:gene18719-26474_t